MGAIASAHAQTPSKSNCPPPQGSQPAPDPATSQHVLVSYDGPESAVLDLVLPGPAFTCKQLLELVPLRPLRKFH